MRQSTLLFRTLREPPADIELPGHQLAARAALFRPTGAGLTLWLPLGQRVLVRLGDLARTAIESVGGQAIATPALQPADALDANRFGVRDRAGRQYALDDGDRAPLWRALKDQPPSYRQLPALLYRIAPLFRDEEKPRGLVRAREFTALTATSLHATTADLEAFYPRMLDALDGLVRACGLEAWTLPTSTGHEFLLPHACGDGVAFVCNTCNYRATADEARLTKLPAPPVAPAAIEQVATPNCPTIADVAAFLNVPVTQTIKTMMYADEQNHVIFALIRGDLDINAAKLERALRHTRLPHGTLRPATEEQIRTTGAVPGYASPIGLRDVIIIADDSIQAAVNMVAGANQAGYHLIGVSIPRDIAPTVVADIAQARAGDTCPECRGKLEAISVIELGGCERAGTELSESVGLTFIDADGKARPPAIGLYGLGLTRILAAVLETHHDDHGLMWPAALAPFDVHLIVLGKEPREQAESLYQQLQQAGLRVLYDDREESPGVKFADADLIGAPMRLTISKRNLDKGCVELKARASTETRTVALQDVVAALVAQP